MCATINAANSGNSSRALVQLAYLQLIWKSTMSWTKYLYGDSHSWVELTCCAAHSGCGYLDFYDTAQKKVKSKVES